ncbi:MAG: hypothetical protein VYE59_05160, partial [Candidatus Thermoplasmatota archaeon]|nr:hypothetical protein [Candidatus Thermoplasmatota archaeon]
VANGISVESPDQGMSLWVKLLIGLAVLVGLLAVLAYFFVEFEDEDEMDFSEGQIMSDHVADTYSWGNNQQQQVTQAHQVQMTTDPNPKLEAYVQQLISQGYDEKTARDYAEQYRNRF